ncbi:hypothetical protein [Moraxella lacunata]|uniref:hypothetical protein n=1 Tax=Moraxella lacunata TaxID=477 RepID=UPI0011C02563|nr:hypothetical protein [Moraxella lacunata]
MASDQNLKFNKGFANLHALAFGKSKNHPQALDIRAKSGYYEWLIYPFIFLPPRQSLTFFLAEFILFSFLHILSKSSHEFDRTKTQACQ